MTAHRAFEIGVGILLVSFLAGANAGKCFEVQSNDHKDYDDKLYFNFYVSDMNGYFGNNWDPSTGVYVSVDQYRDGERIRESQSVVMWNSSNSNPSVGDGHGRVDPYNATALAFETGDFLCLFPGEMMTPIPANSSGVGSSACVSTSLGSATVSGLEECQAKCLADSGCNTINYCNDATLCSSYSQMLPYCTFKKCTGDDYQLSSLYGIFDIYTKMNESCFDNVQNQMEDDVDCGGPNCPICETCTDGIQNQDEEDIDCGGSMCDACLQEETCFDGIQNQDEEDIDCGGSCPPCDDMMCKNKLPRRVCNGKWRNGKCKKPWVQARCMATCGHWSKCCGNKMSDLRCNKLKPYCQRSLKIASRCQKTCGKC